MLAGLIVGAWLTFTAPTHGHYTCTAVDSLRPLRDAQFVQVLKLNTAPPPGYHHGCEAVPSCWQPVVLWNQPVVVWSAWVVPGQFCSISIGPGQYTVHVRGQRCAQGQIIIVP